MSPQQLFVDHDTGSVQRSNADHREPVIKAYRGTTLRVHVGFAQAGKPYVLPNGTTGKLVAKLPKNPTGAALMLDTTWTTTGSGDALRYVFEIVIENADLATALGSLTTLELDAQIEWKLSAEATPRKSDPFVLFVINGPAQPSDGLPGAALSQAWAWFKARFITGANIGLSFNDTTEKVTVSAAGGGGGTSDHGGLVGLEDDDHTQYFDQTRGDARYSQLGHTHSKSQVGLSNVDNTSDGTKQTAFLNAANARFVDYHNSQPLNQVDRRQITINAGLDVSLHAELIGPGSNVTSGSWFAFTLPRQFSINHAYLTCAFDNEASALVTGALLKQDSDGGSEVNLATLTDNEVTSGRVILVENGELVCAAGSRIVVSLSSVVPPYSGTLQGLSLWLHGYWS